MNFAAGYVGDSSDQMKIRKLEKQREDRRKQLETLKKQSTDKVSGAGLREFGHSMNDRLEQKFGEETVGLVTKAEFAEKRRTLAARLAEEEKVARDEEEKLRLQVREEQRRREKELAKAKLSFLRADDDEEGGGSGEEGEGKRGKGAEAEEDAAPPLPAGLAGKFAHLRAAAAAAGGAAGRGPGSGEDVEAGGSGKDSGAEDGAGRPSKKARITKNPLVDTSFLPDREREEEEARERERLKKEWLAEQEAIKNEPIEITYSYWDGTGHRRRVMVRKGDSIGQFLQAVQRQLAPDFREMRATSAASLIFVKEDIILPHHITFHDLVLNKARGKSGPLFDFSAREDIRLQHDASKERDESHAGKVVDRHWYEKNKHIFPANRWEMHDPEKNFSSYTLKGPGTGNKR